MNFNVGGMAVNLESTIKQRAVFLKATHREIDIAPDIPAGVLQHWQQQYRKTFSDDIQNYILVLSDTKTGSFALTGDALYFDNYLQGGMRKIAFADIENVYCEAGRIFAPDQIHIKQCDGNVIDLDASIDGINLSIFTELLTFAAAQVQKTTSLCHAQNVTLCDLPDEAKILYLEILCNKAYLDHGTIDAAAYNTIGRFSIRMDASLAVRRALCRYMNEMGQRKKSGSLLSNVCHLLEQDSGLWDAFRYCLMQDLLYLSLGSDENFSWRNDGFIGSLLEICDLYPEQLDTMLEAVSLNKAMQRKGADLKDLLAKWESLEKKIRYTRGYVATQYLFCSGSVYGIQEYSGFLRNDKLSQQALNKQRELILQKIIENTQQTINLLIEDVNYVAECLEKEMGAAAELKQRYLGILDRFRQGITLLHETEQASQGELKHSNPGQEAENE